MNETKIWNGNGSKIIFDSEARSISIGKNGIDITIEQNGRRITFDGFEQLFYMATRFQKEEEDKLPNPKAKYVYKMDIPVLGRYEAVVYSNEKLTKEEVKNIAFDRGDFGDLKDCDVNATIEELSSSGNFLEEERER